MSGDVTSAVSFIEHMLLYNVQATITGSPVGTLKLQACIDVATPTVSSSWNDVASSTVTISGADIVMYDVSDISYKWVRLVYTRTSGTGAITALINAKGE